jgi:hypothetical protein
MKEILAPPDYFPNIYLCWLLLLFCILSKRQGEREREGKKSSKRSAESLIAKPRIRVNKRNLAAALSPLQEKKSVRRYTHTQTVNSRKRQTIKEIL